ncbi:MAG TPA: pyridoxamine 5'-phosphate oxidase family protein [Methylomirabilota bacterium]|nr:pyridoxamine 5'-phosphate oxidase family protein [Methylomirabilota bacterium]
MTLADAAVQRFLSTKEIVLLATVQPDGAPLAMPMWFVHDPATLAMLSEAGTQKVRNLRRDGRVCVVGEASGGGQEIRGVTVMGRATFLDDGAERRALVDRFHAKYPDLSKFWGGRAMPPNRVMFRITPERVKSWGLR